MTTLLAFCFFAVMSGMLGFILNSNNTEGSIKLTFLTTVIACAFFVGAFCYIPTDSTLQTLCFASLVICSFVAALVPNDNALKMHFASRHRFEVYITSGVGFSTEYGSPMRVYAMSGSTIHAFHNAIVHAESGSKVWKHRRAVVYAAPGAEVIEVD